MQNHTTRKKFLSHFFPLLLIVSLFGVTLYTGTGLSSQVISSSQDYQLLVHDGNCPVTGGGWVSYRALGNSVKEQVHVAAIGSNIVEICAEGHSVDSDAWFISDGLDSKGCFIASGIGTQTASVKENWSKHHNPPQCVDLYNASFRIAVIPSLTPTPTPIPTPTSTPVPTSTPTLTPTNTPTVTATPSNTPSVTPTSSPSVTPTNEPTSTPTSVPTSVPTSTPTSVPTSTPTSTPTSVPTSTPTSVPTSVPTSTPTITPTTGSILSVIATAVPTRATIITDTFQAEAFTTTTTTAPTVTTQASPTLTPTSKPTVTPTGRVLADTVVDLGEDRCDVWPDICSLILFILAAILTLFSLLYHREKKQRENR